MTRSGYVYDSFANAYAEGKERNFSVGMARWISRNILAQQCKPGDIVVDVACGLGAAVNEFSKAGYTAHGVDGSPQMIQFAKKNMDLGQNKSKFLVKDFHDELPWKNVAAVTCMYDALNFMLNISDLTRAFKMMRKSLRASGVLVFDMYTIKGLLHQWGSEVVIHTDEKNNFVVSDTKWLGQNNKCEKCLIGFTRGRGGWRKWQEVHVVKAYALREIEKALHVAGFDKIKKYSWEAGRIMPVSKNTERVIVRCQAC
jgi:SAM-dependent methyltransferase